MKFKKIRNKFQKLFRATNRDKNLLDTLFNRIEIPTPKKPTFQSVVPLYESQWEQTIPTFPEKDWITESFNSVEGLPSHTIDEDFGIGYPSVYGAFHDFDERWFVQLIPGAGYINNAGSVDFNFKVSQGGVGFERKHYRCASSPWRGWEEGLLEGKCPVDFEGNPIIDPDEANENVIENPLKYFNSYNGRLDSSYSNLFPALANLIVRLTRTINEDCQVKMKFKIDVMNLTASGTYGNDVIFSNPYCCFTLEGDPQPRCHDTQADLDALKPNLQLGGALFIIVTIATDSGDKDITYYYPQWSQGAPTPPTNSITLASLANFERILFDDYKTIYGSSGMDEETWREWEVKKVVIEANAHAEGAVAVCRTIALGGGNVVGGHTSPAEANLDFYVDNIRLFGTDEELVRFDYEFETPSLQISEDLLPFVETQILTKMEEDYRVTFNDANEHPEKLWIKMGENLYKLLIKGSLFIHSPYEEWETLNYPQVKLIVSIVPPHNYDEIKSTKFHGGSTKVTFINRRWK